MTSLFNHLCRQRNVTGDDKISGIKPFHDLVVSNIETRCDLNRLNEARWWYWHWLIGHKRQLHSGALCRPE